MHALMVRIGNFFFRWRNRAFPLIILGLYLLAPPPAETFNSAALEHLKDALALALALAGLALRGTVIGYAYIKRGGMQKKVYAENLVTEGVFGICRNPLYLGNVLIYGGVFLMHGDPWVVTAGVAFFLFVYQCIVLAEEAYLAEKFGEGYRAYCAEVPRWLPDFARWRDATAGMQFNLGRVIMKDYTTIATTLVMLALTEGYEYLLRPDRMTHLPYIGFLAATLVACGVWVAAVKNIKKRAAAS